jgi:hypothetical protein
MKPITIQASLSIQASNNQDDIPRFKITANTGVPMNVGYELPVVVDMKGMKYRNKTLPVVADHDLSRRIGHTTLVKKDNQLYVEGIVSSTSKDATEFTADSKRGFPFQSSIGADVIEMVELPEGKSKVVNGNKIDGPVFIATKSVLNEITITTLGADSRTSAIAAKKQRISTMKKRKGSTAVIDDPTKDDLAEIEGFQNHVVDTLKLSWDDLSDETAIALHANFDKSQPADDDSEDDDEPTPRRKKSTKKITAKKPKRAVRPVEDDDDEDEEDDFVQSHRVQAAAEVRRINRINAVVKTLSAEGTIVKPELIEAAIADGTSATTFELTARRAARSSAVIHTTKPGESMDGQVLECALARQIFSKADWIEKTYNEKTLTASDAKSMRGIGLHYLIDLSIKAAGQSYTGSRKCNDYIRAALRATRSLNASGYSTISVPNILENVGNKAMIASYEAQETIWKEIAAVRSLSDFKIHSRYMLDALGSYRKIGATGELKHVSLSDAKFTLQGDTYGAILELTRQDMFNDDLMAFEQIPVKLGMMAAIRIEEAVLVLLLSNPSSFFHANNKNLITGGAALSLTTLGIAEQKFMNQVDSNGKPILHRPDRLLVGTQDATKARNIFTEANVMFGGGDTTVGAQLVNNPHTGKFKPIVSPYLNNTAITDENGAAISGQSATKSYLFCNPALRAALNVGFLNGNQVPTLESSDVDFDRLGMSWRSYHDWGVGMEDPKAAVLDAGA